MKFLSSYVGIGFAIAALAFLNACSASPFSQSPSSAPDPNAAIALAESNPKLKQVNPADFKFTQGELIYVPVYSYIYHYDNQRHTLNLAITLSVRNTDPKHPIIIKSVDFYDNDGKRIKQYLTQPVELPPMASTSFFIERSDNRGGLGANFLVEWGSEIKTFAPIVEAVMVSTEAGRGISFISPGRVVR